MYARAGQKSQTQIVKIEVKMSNLCPNSLQCIKTILGTMYVLDKNGVVYFKLFFFSFKIFISS